MWSKGSSAKHTFLALWAASVFLCFCNFLKYMHRFTIELHVVLHGFEGLDTDELHNS